MTDRIAKKRLFFALWPSEAQRQQIESAIAPHRPGLAGNWTARENWHVTLLFIGGFPEKDIPALQSAASRISCPAICMKFESLHFWQRPGVICLFAGCVPSALLGLVGSLEETVQAFGIRPDERPYRAHMTIARKAGFFEPVALAQPLELEWSGFRLIESVSIPGGVQYRPLKQ